MRRKIRFLSLLVVLLMAAATGAWADSETILTNLENITGVTLDQTSVILTVSETHQLTATVSPEEASVKTVTWTSDNTEVATVASDGTVTAEGVGTATITVTATNGTEETDDDKTATCTVKVISDLPTDETGAYILASRADWQTFSDWVTRGNNYSGKTVKLTEDITEAVTATIGSFAGTFDGQGHVLTINTNNSPFRGIATGGAVKNLIVNGTVTATGSYASGLVSGITGSVTIENCRINVAVKAPSYAGGILGHCGEANTITMRGCVFSGSITTTSNQYSGGLVGWCNFSGTNSDAKKNTLNLSNCFFNGTFSGAGQFHPITIKKNSTKIAGSRSNCFYTFDPKSVESGRVVYAGTRVYSITAGTDVTSLAVSEEPTTSYGVSGLNIYSTALSSNGVFFAASGKAVPLALTHSDVEEGYVFYQYVSSGGTLANPTTDTPTLTMTAANQTVSAAIVRIMTTDESGAYLISSKDDWEAFCEWVNGGKTFSGETVKLTADITEGVTTMAGTSENFSFQGIFDGQNHTLTLALGSANSPYSGMNSAPFRYTKNTTIQNLKMAGDMYVSGQFAGALIRVNYGTSNITNCRVSTVIHCSYKGVGNHGALVSVVRSGTLTITGCVFDGRLFTTNATTNCGGLVGNKENTGTVIVNNSLYAPNANIAAATGETAINSGAALSRNGGTFTNSYYTQTLGTAQGKQACTISAGDGVTSLTVNTGDANDTYDVSGITVYATGIKYNDVYYASSDDEVSLTLSHSTEPDLRFLWYTITGGGTLDDPTSDTPTLTMTAANQTISATIVRDMATDDSGVYLIASKDDWDAFCEWVNAGYTFSGETVKLTQDITEGVTTMAGYYYQNGSANKSFDGTFEGQSHTLTINYNDANDNIYAAPFPWIMGTVQNLVTVGSVTGNASRHTGLAGRNDGNIRNCHVSVDITAKDRSSGISVSCLGLIEGCVYDGKLNAGTNSGGFTAWASGSCTFKDCFFNPKSGSTAGSSCNTFFCNSPCTLTNCYYTTAYGTVQGMRGFTINAGEGVSSLTVNAGDATETYDVSGITTYALGIKYNDVYYFCNGDEVSLTLACSEKEGYALTKYVVSDGGGLLSDLTETSATLTMADDDQTIASKYRVAIHDVNLAEGTVDAERWNISDGITTKTGAEGFTGVAEGTEVKMTYSGKRRIKNVMVINTGMVAVDSITLSKTDVFLAVGTTETLSVTDVAPTNASDKLVIWSSDNKAVATVNPSTGEVTAVGVGTATITATANDDSGVTATCTVTVVNMVIKGSSPTFTIPAGQTVVLDNVSINNGQVICSGNATIILVGDNTVNAPNDPFGDSNYAAIRIGGKGTTLTIKGTGSLIARGGSYCSGIGGYTNYIGNIVITGGTIAAYGGVGAAGIGGGWCGGCQNITITDTVKKVTASKGNDAEHSIGAGKWPKGCGTVTIGGVVGAISQSPYTYEP